MSWRKPARRAPRSAGAGRLRRSHTRIEGGPGGGGANVRTDAAIEADESSCAHKDSHFGTTDVSQLLDIRSFDLDAIIEIEPYFLEDVTHTHDDDVMSFVYRNTTPLDQEKLDAFFGTIVSIYGASMLRYKGVLNIAGLDRRLVFHGVHMIFGADFGKAWSPNDIRETRIVFIGKQLPADIIKAGLDGCA
ncbi:G3E family GTPase [Paraburkholderia silvatlantica]|uniref:G3E family GTPase n=2 Tax=Paraburkholderia silvatlantica TaxID=321895 RepID=A0ABR6FSD6_9BURK|nr:G3E family GTPase [Paraburkholderia silvatlantica]